MRVRTRSGNSAAGKSALLNDAASNNDLPAAESASNQVELAEKRPLRPKCTRLHSSARFAAFGLALEDVDLCLGPRAVTRHGACLEAGEDGVGMLADVVV
jgi:hypothetical protein